MTDNYPEFPPETEILNAEEESVGLACVLSFNANDPSGAGGLSCDATAMASVGAHCLPVCTGAYVRDTSSITDFYPLDEEAVHDQARAVAEDVPVQVIKVGFVGTPESLAVIAELSDDYDGVPLNTSVISVTDQNGTDVYYESFYSGGFIELYLGTLEGYQPVAAQEISPELGNQPGLDFVAHHQARPKLGWKSRKQGHITLHGGIVFRPGMQSPHHLAPTFNRLLGKIVRHHLHG